MADMTSKFSYTPDPAILTLGDDFYDPVAAADFPQTLLRYRDDVAAAQVGLAGLTDEQWLLNFGRFEPLANNLAQPLALRYHGHQFQHYNSELGDGRGFLFAQMRDETGRLIDLGTKGSGTTPWSRRGDGRLTLLGGVREILASRYLEHMGVNTSRGLSLIETGEELQRGDEPSPTRSAVLVRQSHSHIRFGSFQRHAFFNHTENLEALTHYCITHFYPDAANAADMLEGVIAASADTVASWMAAGFVHGVMNTDNMNITGETFDFGPYRFLPTLKSGFTAAYFDHNGLYAFARQPEIMYWNLGQLAQSLSLIYDDKALIAVMESFAPRYRDSLRKHVFRRLGIEPRSLDDDIPFVMDTFRYLEESQANWPQFWHDWQGGAQQERGGMPTPNQTFYEGQSFSNWLKIFITYEPTPTQSAKDAQPATLIYEEIGALWDPIAEQDDWSAFHEKLSTFKRQPQG